MSAKSCSTYTCLKMVFSITGLETTYDKGLIRKQRVVVELRGRNRQSGTQVLYEGCLGF